MGSRFRPALPGSLEFYKHVLKCDSCIHFAACFNLVSIDNVSRCFGAPQFMNKVFLLDNSLTSDEDRLISLHAQSTATVKMELELESFKDSFPYFVPFLLCSAWF